MSPTAYRCDVKPVPIETAVRFLHHAPRKKVKSLYLEKKEHSGSRSSFVSPLISLESYQQRFCPDIANINTRWAVKNFEEWAPCYNQRHLTDACPSGVLLSDDTEELSTWLQTCVLGTRKTNGEKYPARALSTTPAAATTMLF